MNPSNEYSGKRVSLVDAKGIVCQAPESARVSETSKKKKLRHISQLNSSENYSMITSTGTTVASTISTDEPKSPKRKCAGAYQPRSVSYARKKPHHLHSKLINQQRSILLIPRLNLPRLLSTPTNHAISSCLLINGLPNHSLNPCIERFLLSSLSDNVPLWVTILGDLQRSCVVYARCTDPTMRFYRSN